MARGTDRGLGIDWSFPLHVGQIDQRGEDLIHEIGMRCTCNNEDTYAGMVEYGAHVPRKRRIIGCPICDGNGRIYRKAQKIVGIISGIGQSKVQSEGGWLLPGDCTLSVKPNVQISGGDLIVFTWGQPVPDGQVIMRGAGTMEDNAARSTSLEDDEDRLWYNAVDSIHCEDEDGKEYISGSDFILDTSKVIKWSANQPAKGKLYTIKYNAYLEWIAFMPPDVRRDRNRDLGTRVGLRKRHVALANENPTLTASDRLPFCNRISGCS